MEKETNIISDDDFLREILGDVNIEENTNQPPVNDLDVLLGLDTSEETTQENNNSEETTDNQDGDAPIVETEVDTRAKRYTVKDTVATLIESGEWVDMPIRYGDKEYENIEELVEKEKPSKELFELLSKAQKKYKDNLINETYIKIGDKNSTKAKLVDAILNDADYTTLLQYNTEVIQPLQKVDFNTIPNNEKIAEAFVRQCLTDFDGYHPDSLDAVISKLKSDFRLIETAEEYQKIAVDKYNQEVEKVTTQRKEKIKEEEKAVKEDMKNLRTTLKDMQIADDFASKILKLRYTKDDAGKFHYEQLIQEKIKDKAFEAKLMYILLDMDDFIKKEKSTVKNEVSKQFLELVNITPTHGGGGKKTNPSGNLQTEDEDFLRDIGLLD